MARVLASARWCLASLIRVRCLTTGPSARVQIGPRHVDAGSRASGELFVLALKDIRSRIGDHSLI